MLIENYPGTENMVNPWKNHGKFMDFLENHGAWSQNKIPSSDGIHRGYFHAFHASMGQENCKNIPHESIGSIGYKTMENHRKHGNLQK